MVCIASARLGYTGRDVEPLKRHVLLNSHWCHWPLKTATEAGRRYESYMPTVASTRWISLGLVTKWLSKHREGVLRHLDEKMSACAPPPSLRVLLLSVEAFMEPVDVFFKRMKGLTTVVSEQDAMLDCSLVTCEIF
jgi:hypothetical protein